MGFHQFSLSTDVSSKLRLEIGERGGGALGAATGFVKLGQTVAYRGFFFISSFLRFRFSNYLAIVSSISRRLMDREGLVESGEALIHRELIESAEISEN